MMEIKMKYSDDTGLSGAVKFGSPAGRKTRLRVAFLTACCQKCFCVTFGKSNKSKSVPKEPGRGFTQIRKGE